MAHFSKNSCFFYTTVPLHWLRTGEIGKRALKRGMVIAKRSLYLALDLPISFIHCLIPENCCHFSVLHSVSYIVVPPVERLVLRVHMVWTQSIISSSPDSKIYHQNGCPHTLRNVSEYYSFC